MNFSLRKISFRCSDSWGIALVLLLTLSLNAHRALAEGVLIKSEPRDNAVVSQFGNSIKLWFSGNVSERSPSLVVLDSTGKRVDNNDKKLVIGDRTELTTTTQNLQAGRYVVRYRVVTEDGLIVSGILRFEVKT